MNLMLFQDNEIRADNTAKIAATDRRAQHIQRVLRLQPGDSLKAGVINGLMGTATLIAINSESLTFTSQFDTSPPAPLNLTLILGLPRPKMMRRIIQSISSMGVKDIVLINTYKVEKSFWQTPWLSTKNLREQSLLGLEQAIDTTLPVIRQYKLFKPFAEDHLPSITAQRESWFAHPGVAANVPKTPAELALAVGPEGGFTPYEVSKLSAAGMCGFHIGSRILRLETALPALLGRLYF